MRFYVMSQFSALLMVISFLYILFDNIIRESDILCTLQGIQMHFGSINVVYWNIVISFFLLISIMFPIKMKVLNNKKKIFIELFTHTIGFFFTVTMTTIPMIGLSYGRSGSWCWIKGTVLGI
jgi:hypothetical protein